MLRLLGYAGSAVGPARKKHKQQDPPLLTREEGAELNAAIADFFYGTGIPLHHTRREHSSWAVSFTLLQHRPVPAL